MFNKAPWGGLHENIRDAALGVTARGWDVTVACRPGPLVDRLAADGIEVHVVADWDDVTSDLVALRRRRWTVVHAHPFASRRLAQEVAAATGAPLVATFHGKYLDDVGTWHGDAAALVAVSRAHAEMLVAATGADPHAVTVIPNGVRDHLLDVPAPSLAERRADDGRTRVVVASRLDRDKTALLDCVDAIVDAAADLPDRTWLLQVLGDGGDRAAMTEFLETQTTKGADLRVEHLGWVESEDVAAHLRGASLAVASGRGAVQALAVGTPTVAFGSQGVYGLLHGVNLDNGLWGNFGGFPLQDRAVTDVRDDVVRLFGERGFHRRVREAGRIAAGAHLRQSACDDALARLYEAVADAAGPRTRSQARTSRRRRG